MMQHSVFPESMLERCFDEFITVFLLNIGVLCLFEQLNFGVLFA